MSFEWSYISAIIASTLRTCSPILLCALAAAICSKAAVFNIAMEGYLMISAFFSILANYYSSGNVLLAVLSGVASSVIVCYLLSLVIVKMKCSPVVAGMAVNTLSNGLTIYLMYIFFHKKGLISDPIMKGLTKITPFFDNVLPELSKCFYGLTILDYLTWVIVILIHVFLYKTVAGFHVRSIGINEEAAKSLGVNVDKTKIIVMTLSGILCGLAGVLLSMGSVTLFIQGISSGKGYIAMTANNLGASNPIAVAISSLFFGICQAVGSFLQQTSLKGQITSSIPYAMTIVASIVSSLCAQKKLEAKKKKSMVEISHD